MVSDTLFSSARSDWATPQWLFDLLDDRYKFTLDVCATKENAKCWNYYTEQDNGLKRAWSGSVWCNPPYGREIGLWTARAKQQIKYKRLVRAVFLVPNRSDTKWWHKSVMRAAAAIHYIEGRLTFEGAKGSAPFPSVVLVYDHRTWPYLHVAQTINARKKQWQ